MTKEQKQEFTLRITGANKSEMIVILCDMFAVYCEDAVQACEKNDFTEFHNSLRRARNVLCELINSLDRSYDVANRIYEIYRFMERQLIQANVKQSAEPIPDVIRLIQKLNTGYRVVSKEDSSPTIMQNAETVYTGMTYGKNDLCNNSNAVSNRGFFA